MSTAPEARELLELIQIQLESCGVPAVAAVELGHGHLMTYGRRLAVTAEVHELRSGKAHAHVSAWFANPDVPAGKDQLEACIFGYGTTPPEALADAAETWLLVAGAPVMSCLAAPPLLQADHFEGDEAWAVPGGHGFVGPFMGRGQKEGIDFGTLAESPAFQFEGYPRDGRPHMAKVTLAGQSGQWIRCLELDGHRPLQHGAWDGMAAPASSVMFVRFALFIMV